MWNESIRRNGAKFNLCAFSMQIFSGVACLLGNLVLVVSYDSGSIALLYIARLVTGIGAARCISRRYIAGFPQLAHAVVLP